MQKHVMCQVTFVNVEQKSNWWYYSCTKCPTGVKDTRETYECEECKRVVLYPKKWFVHLNIFATEFLQDHKCILSHVHTCFLLHLSTASGFVSTFKMKAEAQLFCCLIVKFKELLGRMYIKLQCYTIRCQLFSHV